MKNSPKIQELDDRTQEATANSSGLVTREQNEVITLNGSFTAGTVSCSRVGKVVTISTIVTPTHTSSASISSASGLIPAAFRPTTNNASAVVYCDGIQIWYMRIHTDGTLTINYFDWDGATKVRTSAAETSTVSYNVS